MKYEPEPLNCPICGKAPVIYRLWDEYAEIFEDWAITCPCRPDSTACGGTKFEAVASWNRRCDSFDPVFEKQKYHDPEAARKRLEENVARFKKMMGEPTNERDD